METAGLVLIPVRRFSYTRRLLTALFVKSRIGEIDVLLIHALLGQSDRLTEAINLSKAIEPVVPQWIHGLFDMRGN